MESLIKELKASAKYEELQNMVEAAKANIFGIRDSFREKAQEINGESQTTVQDIQLYLAALRRLIDPAIGDHEVKPNMKILFEGDLTPDQKHQAQIILNCKDALQRDTMIDDFKKSFQPKPKPKKVVKVVKQKTADGAAADTAGGGGNMEHLQGDLRTLVTRFLDPKVKKEKKTDIYHKLMEPGVDPDFKNLAIQLVDPSNKNRKDEIVKEFDAIQQSRKLREQLEEKRKKELEDIKKAAMRKKMEKKKQEMMKKRDITLKMRAEERRREKETGQMLTEEEREAQRKLEREKIREEIKRMREAQNYEIKKPAETAKIESKEEKSGLFVYLAWDRDVSCLPEVTLDICDISTSHENLNEIEKEALKKLLSPFQNNNTKTETSPGEKSSELKPENNDTLNKEDNSSKETSETASSVPDPNERDSKSSKINAFEKSDHVDID